ncbi:MAG: SusF/SusE family outer membrane protein [Chitinophagaceae bacterium]|nr:MAG: SusF/SusE family outer membrane protein [Chitinophagaceae bacterium]
MKRISQLFAFLLLALAVVSCDKKQDLTYYGDGKAPQLTASTINVAPTATDSLNPVLTFKWSDPQYQVNSTSKYILQIDSVGKNFSNPFTRELMGANTTSIIAKDLNNWMIGRGYAFDVPVSLQARLISSYANNNERLMSNVVAISMKPYRIPPRVAVPTSDSLVIVGAATEVGWTNNNPAQVLQKFVKIDATTWAGIFKLNGGQEFLILPEAGNWDKKYALSDNSVPGVGTSGVFGFKGPGTPATYDANFKAPATTGYYRIELDFQAGRYTITPWSGMLTNNFYTTGAATGDGWANSGTPPASQTFTRISSSEYVLTTTLQGGQEFLILPVAGSWDQKYALADNSVAGISAGGQFGYKGAGTPNTFDANFKSPATTGTYTIRLNLAAPVTPASGASGRFTIQ